MTESIRSLRSRRKEEKMSLLVHKGGNAATRDDLALVPIPEATDSYIPVPHNHLADTLSTIGQDILNGFRLKKEQYALARDGNQMFGVLVFESDHDELGLSIGFRNSYDKSMAVGIAIGAEVFICDNLAFTGDITILRKHTANVWSSLEDVVISTLYRSQKNFHRIVEDSEMLKGKVLNNSEAFKMIGLLFGHNILTLRQLPPVKKEWLNPSHEAFKPRNMWSFYNACTGVLKACPPMVIMEKHIALHNMITGGLQCT
jgi:hypothetical protein